MSSPASRRGLLAGSAAALLAPAVAPIAGAAVAGAEDAEARLLALRIAARQAFDAHEAAVIAFNRADEAGDEAAAALLDERVEAAWDAREAALYAMAEIPASSLAGLAAKADFAHSIASVGASDAELDLMRSLAADTARVLGDQAAPPAAAPPDAELLGACGAYAAAIARVNACDDDIDPETSPLWAALMAVEARADAALPPRTLAGLRAMAELCHAMAEPAPDGSRSYAESYCGDWPGRVVQGVLRLVPPGGAA